MEAQTPIVKLVRLARMDPGMVPQGPRDKLLSYSPAALFRRKKARRIQVPAVNERCAGIDIGK